MPFRCTRGIVSDTSISDPIKEASVIMIAVTVGYAASYIREDQPIQFDRDPLDSDPEKIEDFTGTVEKIDIAIAHYLDKKNQAPPSKVHAGTAPGYSKGAVIVGVYKIAGQTTHPSIPAPRLSRKGRPLYDKIKAEEIDQYTGRGAYTGFVDNNNTEGDTDPVGPRSTARFLAPDPSSTPQLHPRWKPSNDSPLWKIRLRKGTTDSYIPWGIIGGDFAYKDPSSNNKTDATNLADQITTEMADTYGMIFNGRPTQNDIGTYTHGMIQAIYKAYTLGPSCTPYEIAVGDKTRKMASCLPCTLFMAAAGYPPTSTHLGRGESWAPLYEPYNPNGRTDPHEYAVIRDLNNAWYSKCTEYLRLGLEILDDSHISDSHRGSRDAVIKYLQAHGNNSSVAATLVLDAVTVHDSEIARIGRTLK